MIWLLKKTLIGDSVRSTMEGKEEGHRRTCILLGELAKFGLNAAMPHAHPGQRWTDVSGCPWNQKHSQVHMVKQTHRHQTHTDATKVSRCTFIPEGPLFVPQKPNKAVINIYSTAIRVLCEVKSGFLQTDGPLPTFCILLHLASIYTGHWFASRRYSTHSCCVQIKQCLVSVHLCESQPLRDPVSWAANLQL